MKIRYLTADRAYAPTPRPSRSPRPGPNPQKLTNLPTAITIPPTVRSVAGRLTQLTEMFTKIQTRSNAGWISLGAFKKVASCFISAWNFLWRVAGASRVKLLFRNSLDLSLSENLKVVSKSRRHYTHHKGFQPHHASRHSNNPTLPKTHRRPRRDVAQRLSIRWPATLLRWLSSGAASLQRFRTLLDSQIRGRSRALHSRPIEFWNAPDTDTSWVRLLLIPKSV